MKSSLDRSPVRNRLATTHALGCLISLIAGAITLPTAAAPNLPVTNVVVVFKTHFDIGYTDLASNVVKRYRTTMIDDALKVVERSRSLPPEQQFAWTLPGWPLSQIMADGPGQTSARQQRIQRAFQEGRFVVHALPFTTHTELLEPEDLVRGLGYASRISRAAGLSLPRDAKMTDVPCHSWIMPTLLKHAGVDFLHLGCNAASSSPQVPRLFWWEGPDGSRLLTMYTAESYGTGLVAPADWPYRAWLALIHTGDNHGPPTPEEVKKLLDEAKQKLPGVNVRIGRLSDFSDALLAAKPEIPVIRGDMPDTWIHGPMCDPAGARIARNIRPAIATAESLSTQLRAWGVKAPDFKDTIARAYEQSLLYGEHTWGGAQYWVTQYGSGTKWGYGDQWRADHRAGRFQRLEDSWAEHTAYIEEASKLATPLLYDDLQALADAVTAKMRGARVNTKIVVYNPLPWSRGGIALTNAKTEFLCSERGVVVDDQGQDEPYGFGEISHFAVKAVPAMGYRTYALNPADVDIFSEPPQSPVMENSYLKVELDSKRGAIKSIIDKSTGRELVDTTAPFGFGQHLYERFDSNHVAAYVKAYVKINADWAINELGKPSLPPADKVRYRSASPKNSKLRFEASYRTRVAVMEAPASTEVPYDVITKVLVHLTEPYVDLEVTLRGKPADPWPEAGWICLPFKVDSPQFRLGRLGSIIDPAKDIVPGANRNLYAINTGLVIFDSAGLGAGVCPVDNPLVSLDAPGCWKYSTDFVPKRPNVYVNLFNNQWTTNFRLWNQGTWTSRIRIWAVSRYDPVESLIRPALEARFPLQVAVSQKTSGQLPLTQTGLAISRKDVLPTAFGPNPDGPGTLLRLWELAGNSGACQVQLPQGLVAALAQSVDLRGQPTGQPIAISHGRLEVSLRAFAPASFVLRDGP